MQPISFDSRRTLVQTVFVSLLLHAALLYGMHRLSPVRMALPAAATISAVLRSEARSLSPVQPVAQSMHIVEAAPGNGKVKTRPAPRSPRSAPVKERTVALQQPRVEDAPSVIKPAMPGPLAAHDTVAAVPAPVAVSGTSAMPAAAPGGEAAAVASDRVNAVAADDLRQYRIALASAARRFKNYPALARERGWEGTATVAINLSASLPGPKVVLVRSSGRSTLDEQALAMVAQAVRATRLPEGLMNRDLPPIELPVVFSLDGDQ